MSILHMFDLLWWHLKGSVETKFDWMTDTYHLWSWTSHEQIIKCFSWIKCYLYWKGIWTIGNTYNSMSDYNTYNNRWDNKVLTNELASPNVCTLCVCFCLHCSNLLCLLLSQNYENGALPILTTKHHLLTTYMPHGHSELVKLQMEKTFLNHRSDGHHGHLPRYTEDLLSHTTQAICCHQATKHSFLRTHPLVTLNLYGEYMTVCMRSWCNLSLPGGANWQTNLSQNILMKTGIGFCYTLWTHTKELLRAC